MAQPSDEDLERLYSGKIKNIEDQIRNLDDHVKRLDAFMQSELNRNLPAEYKQTLQSTVNHAKQEAGKIRVKGVQAAQSLKQRVNAFKQKHNF